MFQTKYFWSKSCVCLQMFEGKISPNLEHTSSKEDRHEEDDGSVNEVNDDEKKDKTTTIPSPCSSGYDVMHDDALALVRQQETASMVTTLWSDALQDIFLGIPTEPTSEEGGSSPATSSTSLTYGELSWESFDAILKAALEVVDSGGAGGAVQPEAQPRLSFVDIGSGFGRLVLGLACCESSARFRSSLGIEISTSMHAFGEVAKNRLQLHPIYRTQVATGETPLVDLVNSDATDPETVLLWANADVVYICCTLFDADLLARLGALVDTSLKEGAVVVTISRRLPCSTLTPIAELEAECTWGFASVYIERRGSLLADAAPVAAVS